MKLASATLAICCLLSAVSAQWLETTIFVSDSAHPLNLVWNSSRNKVYCALSCDGSGPDSVKVINGATNSVEATVAVGDYAGHYDCDLEYNPLNDKVYSANAGSDNVSVIDCSADTVVATIAVGGWPDALAWSGMSNKVYCGNALTYDDLTVIDGSSNAVIKTIPLAGSSSIMLVWNPTSNMLYCFQNGALSVVDCANDSVVTTLSFPSEYPYDMVLDTADDRVYCSGSGCDSIVVVDCRTNSIAAQIPTQGWHYRLSWNSAADRLYCTPEYFGQYVKVIDCLSNTIVDSISIPPIGTPQFMFYNPESNKLLCASMDTLDNSIVYAIDCDSDTIVASLSVGQYSRCFGWNPVQNRTYVANYNSSSISVIRDSGGGVEEVPKSELRTADAATVIHGVLLLPKGVGSSTSYLLDATGRKVSTLRPGANDVGRLSPGVYFVREARAGRAQGRVIRKIVTAR